MINSTNSRLCNEMADRNDVDSDYFVLTQQTRYHAQKKDTVRRFADVCKDLATGLRIAIKIKDNELPRRYWIVDLLDVLAWTGRTYSLKDVPFSEADSKTMAATFAPVIPLMNEWAEGKPVHAPKADFETGYLPRSFAGLIQYNFLFLYNSLISKDYDPTSATHPLLFVPVNQKDGSVRYCFRRMQFQQLLVLCEQYGKRNPERSETDELFAAEMKKPFEERSFNIDDDEDESLYEDGDAYAATRKSRLKAYCRYRQQVLGLRPHRYPAGSAFDEVLSELKRRIEVLRQGGWPEKITRDQKYDQTDWYVLLDKILRVRPWIAYRDFDIDESDETLKCDDNFHNDEGWPYYECEEEIPERDVLWEIERAIRSYMELAAAIVRYIRSDMTPRVVKEMRRATSHSYTDWGYLAYDEKPLKSLISIMKELDDSMPIEMKLFRIGREIFKDDPANHTRTVMTGLEKVYSDAEESKDLLVKIHQQGDTTNQNVLSAKRMVQQFKKNGEPGDPFSYDDQQLCFKLWIEDRTDPTLVDGHKVYVVDSFEKRKKKLMEHGILKVSDYSMLITRYIKRTGTKIPNIKKRKSENGKGKRKTRAGKRKSTPGKRKGKH